jgi:hypothetical protein
VRPEELLESPDFDGRPYSAGEPGDEWRSRASGWAFAATILLGVVGFYTLHRGEVLTALVMFGLTGGGLLLTWLLVRMDLRHYMDYRHRI